MTDSKMKMLWQFLNMLFIGILEKYIRNLCPYLLELRSEEAYNNLYSLK